VNKTAFTKPSDIAYSWTVTEVGSSVNLLNTMRTNQIQASGQVLRINKNTLVASKSYEVSCSIAGVYNCGSTSMILTTKAPTVPKVTLKVVPTTGIAYTTIFNFTAAKVTPATTRQKCIFGYVDPVTGAQIDLHADVETRNFTNQTDSIVSVLPAPPASGKLTVFARCLEVTNFPVTYTTVITLKNATYNETLLNQTADANRSMSIPEMVLATSILAQHRNASNASMAGIIMRVCNSIAKLNLNATTTNQIDQMVSILRQVVTMVQSNETLSNNTGLVTAVA
jgi:acyl-coenzyme A thioesterase PaaI-like protein